MSSNRKNIKSSLIGMNLDDCISIVTEYDEQKYRAGQIFNWIYKRNVQSFTEMENLPKQLKLNLSDNYLLNPLKILKVTGAKSAKTRKFLLECQDGERIESVLMKEQKRITICLSSQIGCALGCEFCATGTMGIIRNLTVGEIVAQYLLLLKESEKPITNVVFMGMGEPFLNYNNVVKSADLLNHPDGINLGARHITVSTAGIVPQVIQYTQERHRYKLAISLNGSTQEQRLKTMPIAKKYPIDKLIESVKYYNIETKNLVTFEYVLLAYINDSESDAKSLINLISDVPCKLNVIPYNEIGGKFRRPSNEKVRDFLSNFSNASFTVTTRWSKGADINAGCGQLVVN
ncbi:23S rRNA (adenine(2503)-C(2))-methyltransferase RlmN [bacterium]|nr:23S rRNA (adenine(2503)-C(2))-methyltransferase RlmN [bacterium]